MAKTRSMRGEIIDFDLIRIKQQIASAPKTTNIRAREDFIERRLRRRVKRANPLAGIQKGVPQTPQQPVIAKQPAKPALKELPKTPAETKKVEPPAPKRKKISRRTKKKENE